jgi:hypothetical protein
MAKRTMVCEGCGVTYEAHGRPSDLDVRRFCSRSCPGRYQNRHVHERATPEQNVGNAAAKMIEATRALLGEQWWNETERIALEARRARECA